MSRFLTDFNAILWGAPTLILILTMGIWLTLRLHAVQFRLLPKAISNFLKKMYPDNTADQLSSFRSLCTALAATVGTGNLVGVAGAICLGGPGAVFWMWICGAFGMAIKYAEAALSVRYQVNTQDGYIGGPMYMITKGLGDSYAFLARLYCICALAASFGVGNAAQINAAITGIHNVLSGMGLELTRMNHLAIGLFIAVLIGIMLLGGARRISTATEKLVPIAASVYIVLCAGVLVCKSDAIPSAFAAIVRGAFSPRAATGGMLGSAFQTLRIGCSRGVFTNEAGMGTASLAHGSARVSHPAEQGLMGMMEVFVDTILICTLTALVVLTSGIPIPYGEDVGGTLTMDAFSVVYGAAAPVLLAASLVLFALAAVLGWGYYGARCAEYLFGKGAWKYFAFAQAVAALISSVADTAAIWQLSEALNGLMLIPNLFTLALLSPELQRLTKEYRKTGTKAGGGNYADFHQCKPL